MFSLSGLLPRLRDALALLALVPSLTAITLWLSALRLLSRARHRERPSGPARRTRAPMAASIFVLGRAGEEASKCLESVLRGVEGDGTEHQVVLVAVAPAHQPGTEWDDAPTVEIVPMASCNPRELGRLVRETARNEIIVLIDGRVSVERGFLQPLLKCFDDPTVFSAAPRMTGTLAGDLQWTGKTRGDLHTGELRLWNAQWSAEDGPAAPVLWTSRMCSAYRKEILIELGEFTSIYDTSEIGDVDLGMRAWKRGWRCVVAMESRGSITSVPASRPSGEPANELARDLILLNWKCSGSFRRLVRYHLPLAGGYLAGARRAELNLRPLRYALAALPALSGEILNDPVEQAVPERRVLLDRPDTESVLLQRPSSPPLVSSEAPLRILLVLPHLPYPPVHGGAVRMWNTIRTLSSRHEVDVLCFAEPDMNGAEVSAVRAMQQFCGTVRTVERRPFPSRPDLIQRLVHMEAFDCPGMHEAIGEMVESCGYDIVQFHKTEMGWYLLPQPAPVQVLVEHIVFYRAFQREFVKWDRSLPYRLLEYAGLRRYELDLCRRFDAVLTMGEVDASFLRERLPSHPCIVAGPNGVDAEYYGYGARTAEKHDVLFIGNFEHSPNVKGLQFFLNDVFPRVKAAIPDVRLLIVGPGAYDTLEEVHAEPQAVPIGRVEDTRPYLRDCSAFVAPILAGSGTRVKILEAMAAGTPVVSTTLGAEGIDVVSGTHMLLADDPASFAQSLVTVLTDATARERLRTNARRLVDERYSWRVIGEQLDAVYRGLLGRE